VVDVEKDAKFMSCPLQHVPVIVEVRASESALLPPEADVGVVVYPSIACPGGRRVIREKSGLHRLHLFPYQKLNIDRSGVWVMPYEEEVPLVE